MEDHPGITTLNDNHNHTEAMKKSTTLYDLPNELIALILTNLVQSCRASKNQVIQLRLVDKLFDAFLRPYVFKTIQLEFTKLLTGQEEDIAAATAIDTIKDVGELCQAVYCDMMVIRDEEEIERLMSVFANLVNAIPEMGSLIQSLRKFSMRQGVFDENDFKRVMRDLFSYAPNMTRLKLNLPFQVIGKASYTATMLLASTFASVASRAPDHKSLEVLVVDHVSDSTILHICNNPVDLSNARHSFSALNSIVLSLKRQEVQLPTQVRFSYRFWDLIGHATGLQSLCIIGWNSKRSREHRVQTSERGMQADDWRMKSLPYPLEVERSLKFLRYLELKRVDIEPASFILMINDFSTSLKELYLNEVNLKIRGPRLEHSKSLWIGFAPEQTKPQDALWIAEYLRGHESLKLDILRATSLGYDDYSAQDLPILQPALPAEPYDLEDPSKGSRSFDLRFVERCMRIPPPAPPPDDGSMSIPPPPVSRHLYEVTAYQKSPYSYPTSATSLNSVEIERLNSCQDLRNSLSGPRDNNTTSHFKTSIDSVFFNHNERALNELQKIIAAVDRSMTMIWEEIDRISREAERARANV